jgi:hypothetical protein
MRFPYNNVLTIKQQYKSGKITREEAKEQLAYVLDIEDDGCADARTEHEKTQPLEWLNHGPLLMLSDVCATLRMWASIRSTPLDTDSDYKIKEREEFGETWRSLDLAIRKSNFLARLFFTEEGVRTVPCPDHKGQWSGCFSECHVPGKEHGPCPCQHQGNVTGWLATDPKHADLTYWDQETKGYKQP